MLCLSINNDSKLDEQVKLKSRVETIPFEIRAAAALGISIVADTLDYVASPIFSMPLLGDVADIFVSTVLYSLTKSKKGVIINAVEFIPVVGDFIPAYTISTLLWIRGEVSKKNKPKKKRVFGNSFDI